MACCCSPTDNPLKAHSTMTRFREKGCIGKCKEGRSEASGIKINYNVSFDLQLSINCHMKTDLIELMKGKSLKSQIYNSISKNKISHVGKLLKNTLNTQLSHQSANKYIDVKS
jgi:hypothetical protein